MNSGELPPQAPYPPEISTTVFHFTDDISKMMSILKIGFKPHLSLEDISWLGNSMYQEMAYPMVSFCDLPIGKLNEHIKYYGSYGIGMRKRWALKNGLTPALYVIPNSHFAKNIIDSQLKIFFLEDERTKKNERLDGEYDSKNLIFNILARSKPFEGNDLKKVNEGKRLFYHEREWRYVPDIQAVPLGISKANFDRSKDHYNTALAEQSMLHFAPEDVLYILVKNEYEIPALIQFINSNLSDKYAPSQLQLLQSKITSYEHISRDI